MIFAALTAAQRATTYPVPVRSQGVVNAAKVALVVVMVAAIGVIAYLAMNRGNDYQSEGVDYSNGYENAPPLPDDLPIAADAMDPDSKVAILGDSWATGYAAAENKGYADLITRWMKWDTDLMALSGSGYLREADNGGGTVQDRLKRLDPRPDTEMLILQGSVNDAVAAFREPDRYEDTIRRTFAVAEKKFPNAQIVVLGPMSPQVDPDEHYDIMDRRLRIVTQNLELPYISPHALRWLKPDEADYMIDWERLGHPTTEGHFMFAEKLERQLRKRAE